MALLGGNGYAGATPTTNSDLPLLPVEWWLGGNATVEMKVGIREVTQWAMVRGAGTAAQEVLCAILHTSQCRH